MPEGVVYVLGTESSGKTDLVRQLECMSDGSLRVSPARYAPTTGQNVTDLTVHTSKGKKVTMEVRELGGSMVNVWESFIASHEARLTDRAEVQFALVYVVDATAPHLLPLASTMFRSLTAGGAARCASWSSLIVLQKCAGVGAMSPVEVADFFDPEDGATRPRLVEVDSWNGVGVGDVYRWCETFAHSLLP